MENKKKVARVFEEADGYHICDENLPYLDTRGPVYRSKADALREVWAYGYTHAVGSGTYWKGVRRIPKRFRLPLNRWNR